MPKKHKSLSPKSSERKHYLRCAECGHVEAHPAQIIGANVINLPKRGVCGCEEYDRHFIPEAEGIDAIARQQVEGLAA